MTALIRRYKKFLLSVMLLCSMAVFLLLYQGRNHSQALIIYDGIVQNAFFIRANSTTRPVKVIDFFHLPPDKLKVEVEAAPVDLNKPRPDMAMVKVEQGTNVTKTNTSIGLAMIKKTFYPVTLYAPYLIENPTLCSSVPNLSILVIVHTAPIHFDRRANIRLTWTNETYFKHLGRVRVLFLLGRVKDEAVQKDIEKEFAQHGDLLQGDFIDAYRNLTHKGVMAYKWMTERCRNAKLILKVDDDVTINMYDMLTKYLPEYQNKTKQIFCNHIFPWTMPIIRANTSKWYVDETQFRGRSVYPRYCSGFTVVFTNDFIPALYRAAFLTPFFWVDDVYLYGLVPGQVPGIKYNGFKHFDHQLSGLEAIKCYQNVTKTCKFWIAGIGDRKTVETIWMYMRKNYEASQVNNSVIVPTEVPKAPHGRGANIHAEKPKTQVGTDANNQTELSKALNRRASNKTAENPKASDVEDANKTAENPKALDVGGANKTAENPKAPDVGGANIHAENPKASDVGGANKTAENPIASDVGGSNKTAENPKALDVGGANKTAENPKALDVGGANKTAENPKALDVGGANIHAENPKALDVEDANKTAENPKSLDVGGANKTAENPKALDVGGANKTAENPKAPDVGGANILAENPKASNVGGSNKTAENPKALDVGGANKTAENPKAPDVGGANKTAEIPKALDVGGANIHAKIPKALDGEDANIHAEIPKALDGRGSNNVNATKLPQGKET